MAPVLQPRRLRVVALSAAVAGLAAVAVWQQFELQQIIHASGRGAEPVVRATVVRRLHGPRIVVAPRRTSRRPMDDRESNRPPETGFDRVAPGWAPGVAPGEPPTALMENPDFMGAYQVYREGMLDARYAELFRRLNLSADELATFKHLLAEKDNLALDVIAVSEAAPAGTVPAEVARAGMAVAQSDIEASIRSALGNERFDLYRDFEDTLAQRATVAQLERRLSYSTTPLSPVQAESLVRVLAAHAPAGANATVPAISLVVGTGASGVMPVVNPDASGMITDEAVEQSRSLLSTQQVVALRQIQGEQQAVLQAGRLIMDGSPSAQSPSADWHLLLQ
jgi:hypothetical protein